MKTKLRTTLYISLMLGVLWAMLVVKVNATDSEWQYPMANAYVCGNDWSEYYAERASVGRPDHCGIDIKSSSGDTNVYAAANHLELFQDIFQCRDLLLVDLLVFHHDACLQSYKKGTA